ncbi:MAG TPA: alpha/beta fold hydrolase [Rhodanobacteraceae bacterium]|nr:alpha/beta fold hydrolase [Rhodanobacteraceae bacterium]
MTEHVILLHGLWMRGFSMLALRQRLLHAGFAVHGFEYASVVAQPQRSLARLRAAMRALMKERPAPRRVHLVGHSLGGIVALQCVNGTDDLPPGRVVCLGTPLTGSAAARGLLEWPMGAQMLGFSMHALLDGVPEWKGVREVGVVAGCLPHGLGAHLAHFEGAHDGTVSVAETRLPGITDHCVVQATHTGLLLSATAARQTVAFLRNGHFEP